MNLGEEFGTLLFFCLFELLGGAGVGAGLRGVLRRSPSPGCFFLILGSGFGGIPLLVGAPVLLSGDSPSLYFVQVFVFVLAAVVVAFMPDELMDKNTSSSFSAAAVGGVMAMIGAGLLAVTWHEGLGPGMIIGGV